MLINEHTESLISERVKAIEAIADQLPAIVIVHRIEDFSVVYMSPKGLSLLGVSLDELKQMRAEYQHRFFNIEDSDDYWPKFKVMLSKNDMDSSISYFQQVKLAGSENWAWYISATKLFMQDEEGNAFLCITTATAIDEMKHMPAKAERLLEESTFLRENYQKFSTLGKREKEILKMVSYGKSSPEISEELGIASATVDAHRKNIKKKLSISSYYDFAQYARAFDLI
ncbi:helix-turn-helix transcriptional regulator [Dyadobacter subterraneus]|uniref:Helix-turn-helix transcriptional regulator n=1 Tax=Dyadobacter subterraneus TaxID=2773304 RepID=A0ABR9W6P3_9BACT|nr:helix-turn-helix transcriptional regulator [Dyadobacter subterraneus]MBE9461110.1 helix-turn-helix transcriptional regulator [Dyadobacter subterraneus]